MDGRVRAARAGSRRAAPRPSAARRTTPDGPTAGSRGRGPWPRPRRPAAGHDSDATSPRPAPSHLARRTRASPRSRDSCFSLKGPLLHDRSFAASALDTTRVIRRVYHRHLEERNTNLLPIGPEEIGQRSETVRRANLSAIVRELHARGPLSRSELVARTGLTPKRDPRPHRRAGRRGPRHRGARRARSARPAARRPGRARRTRRAPSCSRWRSPSTRSPRPSSGSAATCSSLVRIDRPREPLLARGRSSADLVRAGTGGIEPAPHRDALIGVGVAVCRRRPPTATALSRSRRTSAGATCRSASGSAEALTPSCRSSSPTNADLGALAELRRGAARRRRQRALRFGEVGVGGGLIVDGKPLTGVAGYAGEIGHMPGQSERRRLPLRRRSGCWETEIGEEALLLRAPAIAADGGRARRSTPCSARPPQARRSALAALDHVGRWLGIGLAGLVNVLNPRLDRARRPVRPDLPAGRRHASRSELDRRALPAARASSGSSRRPSASTRRCSAPPSSHSNHCSRDPAGWFGRPRSDPAGDAWR